MKISMSFWVLAVVALAGAEALAAAPTPAVLVDDLATPAKIVLLHGGALLVTEAGSPPLTPPDPFPYLPNQGRISSVSRTGSHSPVLEGLPSGLDLDGANPTGPSGLWLAGRHVLYFEIGQGDSIRRVMGVEAPNPAGPSSALLSSVWRASFSKPIDELYGSFVLNPASDYQVLEDGDTLALQNAFGERVWLSVLADLRDLHPAPPPNAVFGSNPYGLVGLGNDLYLPDAGQNSIVRVNRWTGRVRTITHFPPVPNALPIGGPFTHAVPNSIRQLPGRPEVLVTLLGGFPFGPGTSRIDRVNVFTGAASPFITGLTLAIDVLPLGRTSNGPLLVLEHASGFGPLPPPPAPGFLAPGRLLKFASPTAAPVEVTRALTTPTSMAWDRKSGELFVSEIRTGRIIRLQL